MALSAGIASCDQEDQAGGDDASDPFVGVVAGEPLPSADLLARLADAGAGTLRFNLGWGAVQPGPERSYDFSHFDDLVANAAERGVRVLPTIYGSPPWVAPAPEQPPLGAADLREFQGFAAAALARYGEGGSLWAERPQIEPLPVRHWQLWNEPNSPLFWKLRPDPDEYLDLLRSFDAARRESDRAARVVLGGLFPTPKGGIPSARYLRELDSAGGGDLFGAVAVHPYASTPELALVSLEQTRKVLDELGDESKEIWVTEIGWASAGTPSALTVDPERQAEYVTETFELTKSARDELSLAGVFWYSLSDLSQLPGNTWPSHSGLLERTGEPKPSWEAFAALSEEGD